MRTKSKYCLLKYFFQLKKIIIILNKITRELINLFNGKKKFNSNAKNEININP